jgi:hypothetical protein
MSAASELTRDQLVLAYRELRRPWWPDTLEAAMQDPIYARLITFRARGRGRLLSSDQGRTPVKLVVTSPTPAPTPTPAPPRRSRHRPQPLTQPDQLHALALLLADRAVISDIECQGVRDPDDRAVYDLRPMFDEREAPPDFIEMSRQAVLYAVWRGLIARLPGPRGGQWQVRILRRPE